MAFFLKNAIGVGKRALLLHELRRGFFQVAVQRGALGGIVRMHPFDQFARGGFSLVESQLKKARPECEIAHALRAALAPDRIKQDRELYTTAGERADLADPAVVEPKGKIAGKHFAERFQPATAED